MSTNVYEVRECGGHFLVAAKGCPPMLEVFEVVGGEATKGTRERAEYVAQALEFYLDARRNVSADAMAVRIAMEHELAGGTT